MVFDAYDRGFTRDRTRHYYDVQKLYATECIRDFVKTKEFIELCEDVREHTQQFFERQSSPSIKEIIDSPAFQLSNSVKEEVVAGFRNDRLLYYKEAPDIELIESALRELQSAVLSEQ